MSRAAWVVLVSGLVLPMLDVRAAPPSGRKGPTAEAEEVLKKAGVGTDGPSLLKFFREQSLSSERREQLASLIGRLGDDEFALRETASRELRAAGYQAAPLLRRALRSEDTEVRYRARECLAAVERVPGATLALAALRLVRALRPPGAVSVLLDYLTNAYDSVVEEEVLMTLAVLSPQGGALDRSLTAALGDRDPALRAAAALVLGRSGSAEQRAQVRSLLTDAVPAVRLRAAQGLLAGRDLEAVPELIRLLAAAPPDLAGPAEDLLVCLAGDRAPRVPPGNDEPTRRRCRDAWASWWRVNANRIDPAQRVVDLPFANPELSLRGTARQFLGAMFAADTAGLRRTIDVPFAMAGEQDFGTREDLERFFSENFAELVRPHAVFRLGAITAMTDYARRAPDGEKAVVARLSTPEVKVLHAAVKVDGRMENAAVFLRVTPERVAVVGVGEGPPPARAGAGR